MATGRRAREFELLRQAVQTNRGYADAWRELGIAERDLSHYGEAAAAFREAIALDRTDGIAYRELGVTLSKSGDFAAAVDPLRESVNHLTEDRERKEAYSNLGGALRRLAVAGGPGNYRQDLLVEARQSYDAALRIDTERSVSRY